MLWFSLYDHKEYKSNDKPFVDMSAYKGINDLQNSWEHIFNEFKNYSHVNTIESHFNSMMVEKPKSWRVRSLRVWGTEMYDVQKHFPETMKLLNAIPNVVSMGFNILEPNSKIKPRN
ncbi:MAG: aspartyl/asparaginyl beta-hydroxylase domain-containing protein [Bacteroidetes bacterium]|nr:aspartyl/asparaginyl beta-hydroxylase domain-containing protein [Bacteroidota bacterium]